MKKIGIMTMQRIKNYGSFMQSYALMKLIMSLNMEVQFVDYKEEKPIIEVKKSLFRKLFIYKNFLNFIREKVYNKKFNKKYEYYINKYLNVKSKKNYHPDINELVIGSDEVFNCFQSSPVGFSRELFGYNYNIPKITYAACFGNTTLERIKDYKIDKKISNYLFDFNNLSVRDNNSFNIINNLCNKKPSINIDPVLTMDISKYLTNKKLVCDNYLLVYAYTRRLTPDEEKYLKKFAHKNKLDIVSIGGFQKIAKYNLILDPFEIFNYFKNAKFVITDTFHGTIFSIKVHANFGTIIRSSNKNKLMDLLKRMDKSERVINDIYDIDRLINEKIKFDSTDNIIKKETKESYMYLKRNL